MTSDDQTLAKIVGWFLDQNLMLGFEQADPGWRALIIPDDVRVDFILQGAGGTKLEAAEDAKRRWEAGDQRGKTVQIRPAVEIDQTMPITPQKSRQIGTAIEIDQAMPITPVGGRAGGVGPTASVEVPASGARAGGNAPTEKIEVGPDLIERLTEYGWGIFFGDEPDGRVRGYLVDADTREIIRSATGDDFTDAYLGLGIDLTPPSVEGRHGRGADASDPRGG